MRTKYRVNPSRGSCNRDRGGARSHYRRINMFLEPTTLDSDTGILTHSAQGGKSYTFLPNNAACSAHVTAPFEKLSRADPANFSESKKLI